MRNLNESPVAGTKLSSIGLIRADWVVPARVHAFTTNREIGLSECCWKNLNLSYHCGDDPGHVKQNRDLLCSLLPGEPRWLRQIHGNKVVNWEDIDAAESGADAVFSEHPGQVCAILTADCLPVLFCNRSATKVAASHAGWRGLADGILEATVAAMGCTPDELIAWFGPAIGPDVYEVGADVYDAFLASGAENSIAFKPSGDRWMANLYELARLSLNRLGIRNISGGKYCTYSEPDQFYSHRRDGITGRMATVIWLQEA